VGVPWYRTYFGPDYWAFARAEYSSERTAHEVAYLRTRLAEAPGPRVADLGCGIGRHAVPLALAGFEVVGVDAAPEVVAEARDRAAGAGLPARAARFEVADLLTGEPWPLGQVDAAYCVQAFGLGTDADQVRFLREVRRHLAPGGILVLDHSNPLWIARNFVAEAEDEVDGVRFAFRRRFHPEIGRSRGSIEVTWPDGRRAVLRDDVRLYTTAELVALLRRAGLAVEAVDADFEPGAEVGLDTRYVQVVATAVPVPPGALAGRTYVEDLAGPAGEEALDLRWAPDEVELLSPAPAELWRAVLAADGDLGAAMARRYAVDDPYGGDEGAAAVSRYFGCPVEPDRLTFGAGITSLLRCLPALAGGGAVLVPALTHPDLPAWAASEGCEVVVAGAGADLEEAVLERRPALVHLDRPGLAGDLVAPAGIERVAAAAAGVGAVLSVDEAYASYLGPQASAVALTGSLDNLVVLRSLSKGYSWGGLRVGFAVASAGVAMRVREAVPPLQVAEAAYRMALRLLAEGDVFAPLRDRIGAVKPRLVLLLERLGLEVTAGHPSLPWVLVQDREARASRVLAARGVRAKRVPATPGTPRAASTGPDAPVLRVSVPLSQERVARCLSLLGAPSPVPRAPAAAGRPGGGAGRPGRLRVDVLERIGQADPAEWDEVIDRSGAPIFYRHRWLAAYERSPLQPIEAFVYLVVRDGAGRAVAVLPATVQAAEDHPMPELGGFPDADGAARPGDRALLTHVMHCYDGWLPAVALGPEVVDAACATLARLAGEAGAARFGFLHVAAAGALPPLLERAGLRGRWLVNRYVIDGGRYASFEEFEGDVPSPSAKRHLRKALRRATETGVTVRVEGPGPDPVSLRQAADFCRKTAAAHGTPAIYPEARLEELLGRLGRDVEVVLAERDDRLLGAVVSFLDVDRYHLWAAGVDYRAEHRFSPYVLLFAASVRAALDSGRARIEVGRRNDEFKARHGLRRVPLEAWLAEP
jgi:histidinol-phosphate/aromatic aminotransferase/cobyric acid decarboxylase-like protein/SAM-dependent methyltransferase/predicted N-acyltransferase